ncbi:MAG: hypothetical protein J6R99_01900 [Alphaproteobacteria bacterium]|nr:hypothetical protein [Alphaproteobacteria bacterium]
MKFILATLFITTSAFGGETINLENAKSITICTNKNDTDCMSDKQIKALGAERDTINQLTSKKYCFKEKWNWRKMERETLAYECE